MFVSGTGRLSPWSPDSLWGYLVLLWVGGHRASFLGAGCWLLTFSEVWVRQAHLRVCKNLGIVTRISKRKQQLFFSEKGHRGPLQQLSLSPVYPVLDHTHLTPHLAFSYPTSKSKLARFPSSERRASANVSPICRRRQTFSSRHWEKVIPEARGGERKNECFLISRLGIQPHGLLTSLSLLLITKRERLIPIWVLREKRWKREMLSDWGLHLFIAIFSPKSRHLFLCGLRHLLCLVMISWAQGFPYVGIIVAC